MSRDLQDQFWDIDLSGTEQLVAQRLAWHANDRDGRCWPGIRTLVEKTGLSERTIQAATKSLEAAGHISREERIGMGMVYTIHPRKSRGGSGDVDAELAQDGKSDPETPAAAAPRSSRTPAAAAPTPAAPAPKPFKNREMKKREGAGDASEREQWITGQRGRRIEPDWMPTKPLPDAIAQATARWPPGRYEEVLAQHRDFWLAQAGKWASKIDWDRTWWNRLRELISRDRRNEERGERDARTRTRPGGDGPSNPMVAAAARSLAAGRG